MATLPSVQASLSEIDTTVTTVSASRTSGRISRARRSPLPRPLGKHVDGSHSSSSLQSIHKPRGYSLDQKKEKLASSSLTNINKKLASSALPPSATLSQNHSKPIKPKLNLPKPTSLGKQHTSHTPSHGGHSGLSRDPKLYSTGLKSKGLVKSIDISLTQALPTSSQGSSNKNKSLTSPVSPVYISKRNKSNNQQKSPLNSQLKSSLKSKQNES